jgi:hypothetical protein
MGMLFVIIGILATVMLGGSMPWSLDNGSGGTGNSQSMFDACRPTVNKNRMIQVDVRDGLEGVYVNNVDHPEFNKEGEKWILVKENAPIPAWKVELERRPWLRGDKTFSEMELLGTAKGVSGNDSNPDIDNDVYIGIGWCNPSDGNKYGGPEGLNACLDPLVQDVVFVVARKGNDSVTCPYGGGSLPEEDPNAFLCNHEWSTNPDANPPHTQENIENYWWSFNVYYKASKLPAEPSYSDLPCWMKLQCPNGGDIWGENRYNAKNTENCEVDDIIPTPAAAAYSPNVAGIQAPDAYADEPDPDRPTLIIAKSFMRLTSEPVTIADFYISASKLNKPPTDPIIGTAYNNHFNVRLRQGIAGEEADHSIILDPRLSGHDGPYWLYNPILSTDKPLANSLQLGSFTPGIPSYFYEWWTPSCKPALYFYPEKETQLSVLVKPNGFITQSIPPHGTNGWNIIARPNGIISNLQPVLSGVEGSPVSNYPYLYYEASVKNINVDRSNGWIKNSDELLVFFNDVLPRLGLNKTEQNDFLSYWIPKLTDEKATYYITLIDRAELDRVEPIEISEKPDSFIRIRFYFEKLNDAELVSSFALPITDYRLPITQQNRSGFVVVDWGGILANGSCGVNEIVQ